MLMSFETVNAEGSGTQDDPYTGSVFLFGWRGNEVYIEVGTEVELDCIDGPNPGYGYFTEGDNHGLVWEDNQTLKGTVTSPGTLVVYEADDYGNGVPHVFVTMHFIVDYPELVFLSNPVSDGAVTYA